jgi:hypothetical protein
MQLTLDGKNAEECPKLDECEILVTEFAYRTLCTGDYSKCYFLRTREEWKKPREWRTDG